MTDDITVSDLSTRLRRKAERLRACLGMIYEPKWREIFIQTAVLFEEAATEIDSLRSELFWAHTLRQDAQAQLKRLQQQKPDGAITH
jgi:hypothetical protein